jgi:hypothetical protein
LGVSAKMMTMRRYVDTVEICTYCVA